MSNIDIQQSAIDTIIVMNKAIANLRLYPLTNAIIVNTIDKLEKDLFTLLEQESPLVYAIKQKRQGKTTGETIPWITLQYGNQKCDIWERNGQGRAYSLFANYGEKAGIDQDRGRIAEIDGGSQSY